MRFFEAKGWHEVHWEGVKGFLVSLRKMVVLACSGPATRAAMVAMVLLASH